MLIFSTQEKFSASLQMHIQAGYPIRPYMSTVHKPQHPAATIKQAAGATEAGSSSFWITQRASHEVINYQLSANTKTRKIFLEFPYHEIVNPDHPTFFTSATEYMHA